MFQTHVYQLKTPTQKLCLWFTNSKNPLDLGLELAKIPSSHMIFLLDSREQSSRYCPLNPLEATILTNLNADFLDSWAQYAWDIPYLNRKMFLFRYQIFKSYFSVVNFSYFVIRFLLNSSIVKSDNEIGKVNDKKNLI